MGENGAGKTTLMSIISRNLKANLIEEMTYDSDSEDGSTVFIPSEVELYDFVSVSEFLDLIKKYNDTDLSISEMVDILELKGKEDVEIQELSQGMRKKLSLIPIFLRKYELIILDEPFNSIDLKYIYKLKELLQKHKMDSAILISSHILDTLVDICDEFVVLESGTVKEHFDNNNDIRFVERKIFETDN